MRKSQVLIIFYKKDSSKWNFFSVLIDYDESTKEAGNAVDPTIVKTLCQQLDVMNKLFIKVDDDIEAVDQKAEESITECEKLSEKMTNLEKSQKDKCDSLLGEMKALLVSKTYATREDLTRSLKTIPVPLSKDEISKLIKEEVTKAIKALPVPLSKDEITKMIKVSHNDLSTTIRNSPTPIKKEEVAQMIDKATSNFLRTISG